MTRMTRPTFPPLPARGRRGFSFTEILFAVVILGIGFIMIAAIFPVAIRLNQQSVEETNGAVVAQRAAQIVAALASNEAFATTSSGDTSTALGFSERQLPPFVAVGEWRAMVDSVEAARTWALLRGELVSQVDRRYGFAVAYARPGPDPDPAAGREAMGMITTVIVVGQARGERQSYNDADNLITDPGSKTRQELWGRDTKIPETTGSTPTGQISMGFGPGGVPTAATLQLKRLEARFQLSTTGAPDRVKFASALTGGHVSVAGEGAFVVIANANSLLPQGNTAYPSKAKLNGRVVRLGRLISSDSNGDNPIYELVTGQDVTNLIRDLTALERTPFLTDSTFSNNSVEVLVLGRMLTDPTSEWDANDNPYVGPVQDVTVFTTIIGVRK
jgi:type II secretory pathway pseudopilin PulG